MSGFVFQFHHLLPEFNAVENAEMPMRIARVAPEDRRTRALGLLARVGLGERVEHRPGMLSGGEQQRVALARALIMHPSLLLADEPTGNLDEATADTLQDLLHEMHREQNLTSIIATHNPRLAATCDRVLRLREGRLHPELGRTDMARQNISTGTKWEPFGGLRDAAGRGERPKCPRTPYLAQKAVGRVRMCSIMQTASAHLTHR